MLKFPQPYFRSQRSTWCVQIDGKQITLGADREEAFRLYHMLMAEGQSHLPLTKAATPLITILDLFLDWCQKHKANRTYAWYRDYLQSFIKHAPAGLTIEQLKPFHVQQWVDGHPGWATGKRGAIIAVQRALNWAAKQGRIDVNPIRHMEKPAPGRREQIVSPEEFQTILGSAKDDCFRWLLELSWETGARPYELFTLRASFVDLVNARWVFPVKESKGKKVQRVIYLSNRALEITRMAMQKHPTGPMLRNSNGHPWCMSSVNCRFQRLRDDLGRQRLAELGLLPSPIKRLTVEERQHPLRRKAHQEAMQERRRTIKELAKQHGVKYSLYAIRHSFCTFALAVGRLDAVTVSHLMGHRDTAMISRHYAHLAQRVEFLREAANRAKGRGA